jgi:hypothetical protein
VKFHRRVAVLAATTVAVLALAACTPDAPEPSPTTMPSATASVTPSPSPSAVVTPSETPSPSPTPEQVPADWEEIDPADAGVVTDGVDSVVGAWRTPSGGTVSLVTYANDVDTTDPDEAFVAYFGGEAPGTTHESRVTSAGSPVLVVTVVPEEDKGDDAQVFFFVLGDTIVSGLVDASTTSLDATSEALWSVLQSGY